jgi:hypothetical protein
MRALALLCAVQFLLVLDVMIVGVAVDAFRAAFAADAAMTAAVAAAVVVCRRWRLLPARP